MALGPAWPTAGLACGSDDEGLLEPGDHAALGAPDTVAMAGSGAIVAGESELFPFIDCPQTPQNASLSLIGVPQLLQLSAI